MPVKPNKPIILNHRAEVAGMQPSIWLLPTIHVQGLTYLAVLNPAYKRGADGEKLCLGPDGGFGDNQSFLHVPSRRALGHEVRRDSSDSLAYVLNHSAAAENMIWYFTGHELPSTTILTHLYHEPTPLFSGDRENKDVHIVHLDLGWLPFVPDILKAEFGTVPPAMAHNQTMIARCASERQSVAWMPLEDIVAGIQKIRGKQPNNAICSPSDSPFIYRDPKGAQVSFPAAAGQITKVQQSIVFVLQELCHHLALPCDKRISDSHLAQARQNAGYPAVNMKAARQHRNLQKPNHL